MNTYFTLWHYTAVILISLALLASSAVTLRNPKTSSKASIIFTYIITALALMFTSILVIDSYTKKITLSNLDNQRIYRTEKLMFTGSVQNSGDYPISEVSVEIKIVNKDTIAKEGGPSYQSNAFAELVGDAKAKPSFIVVTEVVATNLKPGQRKNFIIMMPYPSYFKGFTDYIRAFGQ